MLCGVAALGFSGVALASGTDNAVSMVQAGQKDNVAEVVSTQQPAHNMLAGLTIGQNLIEGGTIDKKVKDGDAVNGFFMMSMPFFHPSNVKMIVSVDSSKNKAKTKTDYSLEKLGAGIGVMYPVLPGQSLNVYLGGELGYAKYTIKKAATADQDDKKMYQQLELLTTYKLADGWDVVGNVSYNFTKVKFSGFPVKDSNAVQWGIGVAHSM